MPPPGIALYLIAIIPPSPIREEIQILKEHFKDSYQSKASLNSPPHITLHMPFHWKEAKEERLIAGIKEFTAGRGAFNILLEDFSCFAPRVIYVKVMESEPLWLLQAELYKFCKSEFKIFNAQYRDQPFHPHITLAFRDLKKDRFEIAWAEFKEKKYIGNFIANKITLLKHDGNVWCAYRNFDF